MKNKILLLLGSIYCFAFAGCSDKSSDKDIENIEPGEQISYLDIYAPIADEGQYIFPEMTTKPKKFWSCVDALVSSGRNDLNKTDEKSGLQYHLLCQSIAGLTNKAVDDGKSEIAVWLYDHEGRESYKLAYEALKGLGINEQGKQTGIELARNNYGDADGVHIQIRDLFDGYVLTDVTNNPESNIVASVASHIYNAIIVDVRDKDKYDAAGYEMKYDARYKTTYDSWREFKDRCSNKALVVMPVQTGELRDFAIKNGLFVLNINKLKETPAAGQNLGIFAEILEWLEPGAPIFGWEQGVSEDLFVNRASKTGHVWIPSDWTYNIPMTSLLYKNRQPSVLAKVENPKSYDYDLHKNYVSFWLTDGDNIQWMMNNFVDNFYLDTNADEMKMGFGIPVGNLSMISPEQFANIINRQKSSYTLIETLGGGYLYADNYGTDSNRSERLAHTAKVVAASMKQHRVKILGLIAHDVTSAAAKEGFRAYVEANDQLEGIVAIQYSPYAGGEGNIYWIKNKNGYDIPVVTVKYSLWNHGSQNHTREGTPAYVANRLKNEKDKSFSLIAVHAWSNFKDIGSSNDLIAENTGGNNKGASAAKLCMNHLDDNYKVVSVQELIWRIRMNYRPEQTRKFLAGIK